MMLQFAGLLLYVAIASANTESNGYIYGSGQVGKGQVQLDSHSQSQYNSLPSTIGQSMNSGSGSGVSISGQANSDVHVNYDNDNAPNQVITGNSNANSNGNAATGQLTNNDNSNSANTNGLSLDGHSQVSGNGTGVYVSNNVASNVIKYPLTTTTPCSITSAPAYCPGPSCWSSYRCYCMCGYPADGSVAVPETAAAKSKLNPRGNQRKFLSRSRGQNTAKSALMRSHGPQRSAAVQKPQKGLLGNARTRS